MGSLTWFIVRVGLIAAAAVFFIVRAWRKRPLDEVPFCNGCGYQLSGAFSDACPECGLDLTNKANVRIGHRGHRRRVLAFGVAVLLTSLTAGLIVVGPALWHHDWQAAKPEWWLRSDLRSSNPDTVAAAEVEARRRISSTFDAVDPATLHDLLDAILDRQADTTRTWDWATDGELFRTAFMDGRATPAQLARFLTQAAVIRFRPRHRVQPGTLLPIAWAAGQTRGSGDVFAACELEVNAISINGRPLPVPPRSQRQALTLFPVFFGRSDEFLEPIPLPADLATGTATLSVTYTARFTAVEPTAPRWRERSGEAKEAGDAATPDAIQIVDHATLAVEVAKTSMQEELEVTPEAEQALLTSVTPELVLNEHGRSGDLRFDGVSETRLRGHLSLVIGDERLQITDGVWSRDNRMLFEPPIQLDGPTVRHAFEAAQRGAAIRLRLDPLISDAAEQVDDSPIWPEPLVWEAIKVVLPAPDVPGDMFDDPMLHLDR